MARQSVSPRIQSKVSPRANGRNGWKADIRLYDGDMSSFSKDPISQVVLGVFAVVLGTLIVALTWMSREADRSEAALARDIRTIESRHPLRELKACLEYELRLDVERHLVFWTSDGAWSGSAEDAFGLKAFNSMTEIGVRLLEQGEMREVVISTRQARALRPTEVDAINRCVATG